MAKRSELVTMAKQAATDNGVYIGTGNGEKLLDLTIRDIYNMEKAYGRSTWRNDIKRDLAFIGKLIAAGADLDNALAGDCSGTIVKFLRELGLIKPTSDYRARDFQTMTSPVKLTDLKPADLVFDKTKEATHVGVYLGDGLVFESRGRDYGMVITELKARPWKIGGTFSWWEDDEDDGTDQPRISRQLKYVKENVMVGADVRLVQEALIKRGYSCGKHGADGQFGQLTKSAVMSYQADNGLSVDGIVGTETLKSLGLK